MVQSFQKLKTFQKPTRCKKCNKRRILDKYDLNGAESEFLDDPSQESDELEREYQDDELESEDPDDGEREYQDDRESRDDTFNEDQSEDEFFDSLEDQFI